MKLGTKLLVDRIVGSLFVGLLVMVARRRRTDAPPAIAPDHIVVLKLLGLGSIVQATPLLAALEQRYGDAEFTFVTRRGNDALTQRIDLVDRTLTIDDRSLTSLARSLWSTVRAVRAMKNVCFINLEAYSRLGVLMTLLSGARWTAGFFRNPSDFKLERVFDVLVYFNPGAPISQVYLQLGRAMGCAELAPSLVALTPTIADHREVDTLLARQGGGDGPIILVNPNASELRLERRWPSERFSRVISDLLQSVPTCRIMLIGAPNERAYAETVLAGVTAQHRPRVRNTAGELSLGALIGLIGRARLLLTNDSGPMHIAFCMGTPTVSLFGPVEPEHYAFSGKNSRHAILYHRVYCSPCVHHFDVAPCRGDNVCMKRIAEDDVLRASLALLLEGRVSPDASSPIVYMDNGRALGVLSQAR
ncbi:MAG: glycosyltransferase family 9 protein [Gemmatimonadota bacterium]